VAMPRTASNIGFCIPGPLLPCRNTASCRIQPCRLSGPDGAVKGSATPSFAHP
jgi:hypothetical protein